MGNSKRAGSKSKSRRPTLTAAQARAFVARWRRVNDAEIDELRRTPPAVKLRQLAALMAWVGPMGWTSALADQAEEVRRRWNKLRKALGVR